MFKRAGGTGHSADARTTRRRSQKVTHETQWGGTWPHERENIQVTTSTQTWAMSPASSGDRGGRWMSRWALAKTVDRERRMPLCTGELKDISSRLDSGEHPDKHAKGSSNVTTQAPTDHTAATTHTELWGKGGSHGCCAGGARVLGRQPMARDPSEERDFSHSPAKARQGLLQLEATVHEVGVCVCVWGGGSPPHPMAPGDVTCPLSYTGMHTTPLLAPPRRTRLPPSSVDAGSMLPV